MTSFGETQLSLLVTRLATPSTSLTDAFGPATVERVQTPQQAVASTTPPASPPPPNAAPPVVRPDPSMLRAARCMMHECSHTLLQGKAMHESPI
jgi:hypothetical protein